MDLQCHESDIREMYSKEGRTQQQICQTLGCSRMTLRWFLKKHRIKKAGRTKTGPGVEKKFIIPIREFKRLYVYEGWTTAQMARRYGCSLTTIRNFVFVNEVYKNQSVGDICREELERLYLQERLSLKKIASTLEVPTSLLNKALVVYGLKTNRKSTNFIVPWGMMLSLGEAQKEVRERLQEGETSKSLAEEYGISLSTMRKFINLNNLRG